MRRRRAWIVSVGLTACLAVGEGAVGHFIAAPAPSGFSTVLNLYDRGQFDSAVGAMAGLGSVGDIFEAINKELPVWLAADPKAAERRHLIAAAVLLELAHADVIDAGHKASLANLACMALRAGPPSAPSSAEHWWYLASVATLEAYGGTRFLLGEPGMSAMAPGLSGGTVNPRDLDEWTAGHLAHARARFPDEPRFQLAELVAREALTARLRPTGARAGLEAEILPEDEAHVPRLLSGRGGLPGVPSRPASVPAVRANVALFDAMPGLVAAFEALGADPVIGPEALLRAGELRARLGPVDDAVRLLARAADATRDPFIRYVSFVWRGWLEERASHTEAAAAWFRRALVEAPNGRTAAFHLSAQLMLLGRQQEAYAIVDAAVKAKPTPDDPWLQFKSGDGRWWPSYRASLREALRP